MGRASKYKYETGDEIGLYRVIKVLPSEPHVKNLVIYAECLLCSDKVKRFSNRLDSKHRGCTAVVKVDKTALPEPVVVVPKAHVRKDGTPADVIEEAEQLVADANPLPAEGDSEDFVLPETMHLPQVVQDALNFDVDEQAVAMVTQSKKLDPSARFMFMTTFKRYLTLVHIARRLEKKIAEENELTVLGSTGSQVSNPLITQYKTVSSESNSTAKILTNLLGKISDDDSDDPLLKALNGGDDDDESDG